MLLLYIRDQSEFGEHLFRRCVIDVREIGGVFVGPSFNGLAKGSDVLFMNLNYIFFRCFQAVEEAKQFCRSAVHLLELITCDGARGRRGRAETNGIKKNNAK